jgi:hypothetical protein
MKRAIVTAVLTLVTVGFGVSVADANPGPGESNQCAPGQHGNDEPGFKPAACGN